MRPAALNNPWARRSAAGCWACLQAPKNHRRAGRSGASTGQDQAKPKSMDSERVRLPTDELVALCPTLDFVPQFGGPARHCWRQVSHLTIFCAVGPEPTACSRQRRRHVGSSQPKGSHDVDETGVARVTGMRRTLPELIRYRPCVSRAGHRQTSNPARPILVPCHHPRRSCVTPTPDRRRYPPSHTAPGAICCSARPARGWTGCDRTDRPGGPRAPVGPRDRDW